MVENDRTTKCNLTLTTNGSLKYLPDRSVHARFNGASISGELIGKQPRRHFMQLPKETADTGV